MKTYLGRPWRPYASVVFLHTQMSEVVRPAGWHNWNFPEREKTVRYAEFDSAGPGANPRARVGWARQLTKSETKRITLEKVLGGSDGWNPRSGKAITQLRITRRIRTGSVHMSRVVKASRRDDPGILSLWVDEYRTGSG